MKKKRALVIAWHRYVPYYGTGYRVLWEDWLKRFEQWGHLVDAFYLIDSDMEFTKEDEDKLQAIQPNTKIYKRELHGHHWVQFKWILPEVQEESILFLDNDVVITNPLVIDEWFQKAERADFVGSFDGSGGITPLMWEKFPWLKERNYARMGSYYFILTRNLLNKIEDIDFTPLMPIPEGTHIKEIGYTTKKEDWVDSFGMFTIKMLATNPIIEEIVDDRSNILLLNDGISRFPNIAPNRGYYHIRNGNFANYIISSWEAGMREDYLRTLKISPQYEVLRTMAWFSVLGGSSHITDRILSDVGVDRPTWQEYITQFIQYHHL